MRKGKERREGAKRVGYSKRNLYTPILARGM